MGDEQFVKQLFCSLLTDILDKSVFWDENTDYDDIIEKVLLDDVSYAKNFSTMSDYAWETPDGDYDPISPFLWTNCNEQITFRERRHMRQNAMLRLFNNTRPIEMFASFFQETNANGENKGFGKLNKMNSGG